MILRTEENREVIELLLYGQNRGKLPTVLLTQDDGTLRSWTLLIGRTITSHQEINLAAEETGELRVVTLGSTSGGVLTNIRVDAAGFQRTREFESWEGSPDVVPINTTATTIYTVPASTTSVVEIELANNDTVVNTYDFHIVPSAGAAAAGNRMRFTATLQVGEAHRLGPFHVDAGVFFQALVTTVAGSNGDINAIAIVREFGTGDAVAL